MTSLAVPDVRLYASWAATLRDFGEEFPHGSGIVPDAPHDVSVAGCAEFVADRLRYADPAADLPDGRVPCSYFWIVGDDDADEVIGFLAVRHQLNDWLLEEGGHIGYSVRPGARRRGHATRALQLGLAHATGLGIERVLVTCEATNPASRRTIVGAGGVLEDVRGDKERYWFDTDVPRAAARLARATQL